MRNFKVNPPILIALLIVAGGSSSSDAEDPKKRMEAALKRGLESSNFAVQRRLAELKDISDEDWGGFELVKSDEEWRRLLTPERYYVVREKGSEPEISGQHLDNQEVGIYYCACGQPLFHSRSKVDSGNGWPSFRKPLQPRSVVTDAHSDWSHEHGKIELLCAICGSHLGHVASDGPEPEDLWYQVNSLALDFSPAVDSESIQE